MVSIASCSKFCNAVFTIRGRKRPLFGLTNSTTNSVHQVHSLSLTRIQHFNAATTMRSDEGRYNSSTSSNRAASPPASDVWSTERRLAEKAPPGAPPRKRHGRRSSMPNNYSPASSNKRQQIIQHPNRIDDEDSTESELSLSLPRPTRLVFDSAEGVAEQQDPTTVLLLPQAPAPWFYEMEGDEEGGEEEDLILSPRLFGSHPPYYFAEPVEDRNDDIFRQHGNEEEGREVLSRHSSWSPSMRHNDVEDRV